MFCTVAFCPSIAMGCTLELRTETARYPMAPRVVATLFKTVAEESLVSKVPISSRPFKMYLRKVARVPEVGGLTTGTMGKFGPPTCCQLRILPVEKISMICCLLSDVIVTPGEAIMVKGMMHTR